MPTLEQINSTTYRISSGRDVIELGDLAAGEMLGHMKYKRWHGNSEFTLSHAGVPSGLLKVDMAKGIIRIPYGDTEVELTTHDPDGDNPDGKGEFNVILNSRPTPDVNGEYWQVLDFDTTGFNLERTLGLDEEWSQEKCYEEWYLDLYDNHKGNDLYGHDNGTGIFVRTPTEIRTPDGKVVIKSKPEHLVHSLLGTAAKNTHRKHNLGEIKADTPNKGKQLMYTTVSRDHLRLPRREIVDNKGKRARIEDIQIDGSQIKFKLPKDFIEKPSTKYPIRHATGLDPAYTEDIDSWVTDYGSDSTWEDYDIFTNHGVPKGAVAEVIIANQEAGYEAELGIRTDGGSLNRDIWLHEAEGGGVTTCRMFVLVDDSTGLVETWADDVSDVNIFYLVGYWENVEFTETFSTASGAVEDVWTEFQLADAGAASRVCHFSIQVALHGAYSGGIRATDSSLDRRILIHEAENGGVSRVDMFAKADSDYKIDYYGDSGGTPQSHLLGYFGAEMDFVELFQLIDHTANPSTWQVQDLTAYLDEDGRVCDFLLTHNVINAQHTLGVRDGDDSTTDRFILEHEAEDDGFSSGEVTGFGISAKSNASGVVNLYSSTTSEVFYLTGYFKPAVTVQELTASPVAIASSIQNGALAGSGIAPLASAYIQTVSSVQASGIAGTGNAPLAASYIQVTSSVVTGTVENVSAEQELTAAPVTVTSSIQQATLAGTGEAPLTGTVVSVASSVQLATISGTGNAPLSAAVVAVASSISQASIGFAQQYLTSSPVDVASSVQTASISGSGNAPLTGTVVSVVSSVSQGSIAGSGNAPLTGTFTQVASSVQQATIAHAQQYLASSPVDVASSVQVASVAGTGIAPLTGVVVSVASSVQTASIGIIQVLSAAVVAVASSVQQATLTAEGEAPLIASPVTVASSIQAASIAGSGEAPLTAASIGVTSSVQQASIFIVQTLTASPVSVASSVQNATLVGTGIAGLTASPVSVTSSVSQSAVSGIGNAPLTASPVSIASSVQQSALTAIEAPLTASPVAVTSSVQAASIAGLGTAGLAASPVVITSSVVQASVFITPQILVASPVSAASSIQQAALTAEGEAPLTASPIAVASSVSAASIAGSGNAPLTGAVVSVSSSVVNARVATTQKLAASPVAVVSSVQAAAISGSGIATLTSSSVAVTSSIRQASIAGVLVTLAASPIQAASSVVTASISGAGTVDLTASPIDVTATVQSGYIAGAGVAGLMAAAIEVAATIQNTALAGIGVATLTSAPIRVTSSIATAIVSGSGVVLLSALPISVSTSIQTAIAVFVWRAIASGSGVGLGTAEALLDVIAEAMGEGIGSGQTPGVIRILRDVKRPPKVHDLGRVKSVSYNLGTMQTGYTLGKVKKTPYNLGKKRR